MTGTLATIPSMRFEDGANTYRPDTCAALKRAAQRGRLRLRGVRHGAYPGSALPEKALPELRSAGYWDAPTQQDWGLDWHRNEGIELTLVSRGSVPLWVDADRHTLGRGQLAITRPWQRHRLGAPHVPASRVHWLILDVGVRRPNQPWRWPEWLLLEDPDLQRLTQRLRQNERPVWSADRALERAFESLAEAIEASGEQPAIDGLSLGRLKLAVNGILLSLAQRLEGQNPVVSLDSSLTSSQRAVELFLRQDLPHRLAEPWTLRDMAKACGLGRSRFAHYCRRVVGLSPTEHLTRLRIEAAGRLLRSDPRRKISEVARLCGFGSSQYFATVFRFHTGRRPRSFQNAEEAQSG